MKKKLVATLLTSIFVLGGVATPSFAKGLNVSNTNVMYSVAGTTGTANDGIEVGRMNINNALRNNSSFYSVGSHSFSKFTFADTFYNVDGAADINFSEITWGNGWYEEAVEVYLVNPTIKNADGVATSYTGNDFDYTDNNGLENDNLYFAGVAFNKMVNINDSVENYKGYESRKVSNRNFVESNVDGGNIGFNLPEEVVSAEGIVLVDITGKVYSDIYKNDKFLNDDGFDLASIKVYAKNENELTNLGVTGKGQIKLSELDSVPVETGITKYLVSDIGEVIGTYTVKYGDGTKKKIKVTYELNEGYTVSDTDAAGRYGVSAKSFEDAENNRVKFGNTTNLAKLEGLEDTVYIHINFSVSK